MVRITKKQTYRQGEERRKRWEGGGGGGEMEGLRARRDNLVLGENDRQIQRKMGKNIIKQERGGGNRGRGCRIQDQGLKKG